MIISNIKNDKKIVILRLQQGFFCIFLHFFSRMRDLGLTPWVQCAFRLFPAEFVPCSLFFACGKLCNPGIQVPSLTHTAPPPNAPRVGYGTAHQKQRGRGAPTHPPGVAPGATLHAETRQGKRGGGAVQPMSGGEKVISRKAKISFSVWSYACTIAPDVPC